MSTQKQRLTYDEVAASLPTLETEEQVNLLEVLSSLLKKSIIQKRRQRSLSDLEGLGADLWTGVDVDNYLRKERDSWN